jgi:hypothetical protein
VTRALPVPRLDAVPSVPSRSSRMLSTRASCSVTAGSSNDSSPTRFVRPRVPRMSSSREATANDCAVTRVCGRTTNQTWCTGACDSCQVEPHEDADPAGVAGIAVVRADARSGSCSQERFARRTATL